MKPLFQIQRVIKKYKDITALDDVTFTIFPGEILGYIGPNGAGKTTTIKILVGLIRKYQGEIFYNDISLSDPTLFSSFHTDLGYLPQEADFQEWRTVDHALRTFGLLSGIPRENLKDSIARTLALVGLSDVQNKKIMHLSGGMKQKLKIAQALLHNPKFLILDEPLNGLDPSSRYQVKNLIKDLHRKGLTIFLSSHILSDIDNLATRIAILYQGKIRKTGTPEELKEEFRIATDITIAYSQGSVQIQESDLDCIQSITREAELSHTIHIKPDISTDDAMFALIQHCAEEKINIKKIQMQEPNLEDVYMRYTGGGY